MLKTKSAPKWTSAVQTCIVPEPTVWVGAGVFLGVGKGENALSSILLLLSVRVKTQEGKDINRGVNEVESRGGADTLKCRCTKMQVDILSADVRIWLYL